MKLQEYVISVLLPVYNPGNFLPECLESLKNQTYQKHQIIAIDDHFTDNYFDLLPKDLLYFKSPKYPLVFKEVFVKLFQYGKVANLSHSLYFHREGIKKYNRKNPRLKQTFSMIRLWLTSRSDYDYRPSLRSLFT